MGCGESKHAVATGNTISQSKKSSDDVTKKSRDTETIPEKPTYDANTNSLVQQCQEISQNGKEDSAGGNAKVVADTEVVNENAVLKEGDDIKELNEKKGGGDVKEGDKERKLTDAVEEKGSVEETKTVTMNGGEVKEGDEERKLSNAAGEKGSIEEAMVEKDGDEEKKLNDVEKEKGAVEETKMEIDNEPAKRNEEDLIKEAKVVPTVESKDSVIAVAFTTEQVKLPNTDEENVTDSSTKDPNAN